MVHLQNHRIWSTLHEAPTTHEAILEQCDKHLVYLGFGIFLRLVKKDPVVLGTLSSDDPETQQKLLIQARLHTKLTPGVTGTTITTRTDYGKDKKKPSAAAGSAAQLPELHDD